MFAMFRFLFSILFLSLCSLAIFCQPNRQVRVSGIGTTQFFQTKETNIIGTPYLSNNFMFGNLVSNNDTIKAAFRYNIYNKVMEMIFEGDTLSISSPFKINEITFSNRKFIYCLAIETKSGKQLLNSNYYEVVSDGYCQLLLKRVKKMDDNAYVRNYMGGGGDGRARYSTIKSYYIKFGNKEAVKVSKNKRSVLSFFKDKEKKIISFIEKEELQLSQIEDIAKVVEHYNALLLNEIIMKSFSKPDVK